MADIHIEDNFCGRPARWVMVALDWKKSNILDGFATNRLSTDMDSKGAQ
jgi:hypothetical protein